MVVDFERKHVDAREFLIDFCMASRDSKFRQIESMALSSPSSEYLDDVLECYQGETDKWNACLQWLKAQGEVDNS